MIGIRISFQNSSDINYHIILDHSGIFINESTLKTMNLENSVLFDGDKSIKNNSDILIKN